MLDQKSFALVTRTLRPLKNKLRLLGTLNKTPHESLLQLVLRQAWAEVERSFVVPERSFQNYRLNFYGTVTPNASHESKRP